MNATTQPSGNEAPKKKKGVALAGVSAGTTAICTVGHTGNDLHYRGYDIIELAKCATFEEVAYLLIHGELPSKAEPPWQIAVSGETEAVTAGFAYNTIESTAIQPCASVTSNT